jgi:hypothetical protein
VGECGRNPLAGVRLLPPAGYAVVGVLKGGAAPPAERDYPLAKGSNNTPTPPHTHTHAIRKGGYWHLPSWLLSWYFPLRRLCYFVIVLLALLCTRGVTSSVTKGPLVSVSILEASEW